MTDRSARLCALVAKHVFGWEFRKPTHGWCCTCQICGRDKDECYVSSCDFLTDAAAAMSICEKMFTLGFNCAITRGCLGWFVSFTKPVSSPSLAVEISECSVSGIMGEAICMAALKALGVDVEKELSNGEA